MVVALNKNSGACHLRMPGVDGADVNLAGSETGQFYYVVFMTGDVKFELFELLPESERVVELQKLKVKNYHTGQVLYEQGDVSDLYFIFSGKVRIGIDGADGETAFFRYRVPGDFIGFYSALTGDGQPVTALAVEDTRIGLMPGQDFEELVLSHRPLCKFMLRRISKMLVAENLRIGDLILLEASRRLPAELLRRAAESGNVFEIPGRQELASRLGMTRETLSRHLSDLQKRGIIAIEIRKVKILDAKQLADLVG